MAQPRNPFPQEQRSRPSNDLTGIWPTPSQPSVFDWTGVDGGLLRAALHVCTVKGVGISFGAAMGGRGIVVTLYTGVKPFPKRFAIDGDELAALLNGIIDGWGSPSEDLGPVFGYGSVTPLDAD